MATGKKYTVKYHLVENTPVLDSIDFSGTFSYTGSYTTNAVCSRDSVNIGATGVTTDDAFTVVTNYASGEAPATSTTQATFLSTAVSAVATAGV